MRRSGILASHEFAIDEFLLKQRLKSAIASVRPPGRQANVFIATAREESRRPARANHARNAAEIIENECELGKLECPNQGLNGSCCTVEAWRPLSDCALAGARRIGRKTTKVSRDDE